MDVSLGALIDFYQFTTGRTLFALEQVVKAAKAYTGVEDIVAHANVALEHARSVRNLEGAYAVGQRTPKGNAKLVAIDVKVDRAVVALRDATQAHIDGSDEEDADAALARKLLEEVFPKGVQAITQLSFVDELSAVDSLLAALKKQHAEAVKALGLARLVKRLATVTDEYRAALSEAPVDAPDKGAVRAANARKHELVLEVVAMIAGRFPTGSKEHVTARQDLLGPILRQQEAIGLYIRSRRSVEDVDPDTGNVEPTGDTVVPPLEPKKTP